MRYCHLCVIQDQPHEPACLLCNQEEETMQHLLINYPFSQLVWYDVLTWIRETCQPRSPGDIITDWWHAACVELLSRCAKGWSLDSGGGKTAGGWSSRA